MENILLEKKNRIAYLTINREAKLNALNSATLAELSDAIKSLQTATDVRVIILTGAGEKSFVAGADISEFAHFSVEEGTRLSKVGHEQVFNLIEQSTKPVIAAVNGFALGGGLELAMSCHIRIASENAKLGLPEVGLGVIPGYGGTQRLTHIVGKGRAMELILTADVITAQDALTIGLVNKVVPSADLMATCEALAAKMISKSGMAQASAIRAVNASVYDASNGLSVEVEEFGKCFGTAEFKEGTSAFLEKRKPSF